MVEMFIAGLSLVLILAPLGCAAWLAMLWLALRSLRIDTRTLLREISLPEAIFFSGYGFASAYLVASLFSRFI